MARKSVYFGTDVLDKARRRLGMTNEEVWEELGIGETTWMRWKRDGSVPVERLTEAVLLLELPMPKNLDDDISLTPWKMLTAGAEATETLEKIEAGLRRLTARVRTLEKRVL